RALRRSLGGFSVVHSQRLPHSIEPSFATSIEGVPPSRVGFPDDGRQYFGPHREFPHTSTTGFVNRRSGVQSSQPAPARNHCGTGAFCIFGILIFLAKNRQKPDLGVFLGAAAIH